MAILNLLKELQVGSELKPLFDADNSLGLPVILWVTTFSNFFVWVAVNVKIPDVPTPEICPGGQIKITPKGPMMKS